jgi:hypothetical protein
MGDDELMLVYYRAVQCTVKFDAARSILFDSMGLDIVCIKTSERSADNVNFCAMDLNRNGDVILHLSTNYGLPYQYNLSLFIYMPYSLSVRTE